MSQPWSVRTVDDGTMVRFTHRDLDAGTAILLFDALLELAIESNRPVLYLDLGSVVYLSSAVLGRLIVLDRKLQDAGGSLALFNLTRPVNELLQVSRLTDLLDVRGVPLPTGVA